MLLNNSSLRHVRFKRDKRVERRTRASNRIFPAERVSQLRDRRHRFSTTRAISVSALIVSYALCSCVRMYACMCGSLQNTDRKELHALVYATCAFQASQSRSAARSAHGKTYAKSSANRPGPARQKGINYLLTCRLLPKDFGSPRVPRTLIGRLFNTSPDGPLHYIPRVSSNRMRVALQPARKSARTESLSTACRILRVINDMYIYTRFRLIDLPRWRAHAIDDGLMHEKKV